MPRRVRCTFTYVGQTAVNFNIPKAEALIVGFILRLRRQDAAKAVNDVAIIAIDHIPVGRLHLEPVTRRPGTPTQHTPITAASARAAFVSIKAPFPNVSADVVQA
jgi:hypothetical protein